MKLPSARNAVLLRNTGKKLNGCFFFHRYCMSLQYNNIYPAYEIPRILVHHHALDVLQYHKIYARDYF